MQELWRDVEGMDYEVSNLGKIKSKRTGRELRPFRQNRGYLQIKLCRDGQRFSPTVHRLVAAAFIGSSTMEINHKDGNKSNNRVDNLEYVTRRENMRHAVANGMHKAGNHSKISAEDVLEIRRRYELGKEGYGAIAKDYCITKSNVNAIVNRRSWKNI